MELAAAVHISSAKTLTNKVNHKQPHQLTPAELVALQLASGDLRILNCMAAELDCAVVPLDTKLLGASDAELLGLWAECVVEEGETATAIRDALADGDIEPDEFERIQREIFEDFTAKLALLQRLQTLVVPAKTPATSLTTEACCA